MAKIKEVQYWKVKRGEPCCNISQTTMATGHRNLNYSLNVSESYR